MKIINDIVYIEWAEMLQLGLSSNTLKSAKLRASSSWKFINDPDDGRKVLIEYSPLPEKYKDLVIRQYGNPLEVVKSNLLDQYMTGKPEDIDFLVNYKLANGKYIPRETLDKYITAVKVLHFCSLMADKTRAASIGIPDMKTFWELVANYITKTDAALPVAVKRLQAKLKEYKEEGPQIIVSRHFLNNRAAKVDDELAEAYLLQLIGHGNRPDDVLVADRYNTWAMTMGLPSICPRTVCNYRSRHKMVITLQREGKKAWSDQFSRTKHRERPSIPLALINSDDNDLDLYFLDDSKGTKNYYKRAKIIVVIDVFNNYPLGWAVGETVTIDLVREAYANAIDHIKQMTGDYFIYHQIQADKWAKADLIPWYKDQAIFIEGRTGNSRARRIESFFNHEWHNVIGQLPNYTGHNIIRGISVNPDALEARKKDFPHYSKAHSIAGLIIEQLRQRKVQGSVDQTIQQQWITAWSQVKLEQQRSLSDVNRLMWFGRKHSYKNTITKDGIIVTINGNRVIYDVPMAEYQKHVGRQLNVAYSPYDPSKILAYSDDHSVKIICPVFEKFRDTVIDMQPGDRARLNSRIAVDDALPMWVSQKNADQIELLNRNGIDSGSILITGNFKKELSHIAQEKLLEASITGTETTDEIDILNQKTYESYDEDLDI